MPSQPTRQGAAAEADLQRYLKPGETLEQLYTRSVREVQKWRRRRQWTLGVSWGGLIFTATGAWAASYIGLKTLSPAVGVLLIVGAMLGLLAGILMRPTRRNALNSLLQTDDVRAVGPLLEAMQIMLPEITMQAADALIRLLPRLSAEQAALLTPLQHRCLRNLIADEAPRRPDSPGVSAIAGAANTLNLLPSFVSDASALFIGKKLFGYRSEALSVAVVQALAQIGDARDLELIRRIAANPVQQAALQAQARLENRIKNANEREAHLREASAAPIAPEGVVRPAPLAAASSEAALLEPPTQEASQTQSLSS